MWWDRAAEYSEHWATGVSTWRQMKRRVSSIGDRTGHDVQDKDPTMVTRKRTNEGRGLLQWVGVQKGERGDFGMRDEYPFLNASDYDMRDWPWERSSLSGHWFFVKTFSPNWPLKLARVRWQHKITCPFWAEHVSTGILGVLSDWWGKVRKTGEWKTLTVNNQQSCTPYTLINPQNPLECAWHMCLYVWYAMCHENCGVFWLVCACTCADLPWWSFKSTMSRLKKSQFTGNVFHTQIYQHICNTGYTHSTSHIAGFTFSYFHYNLSPFCQLNLNNLA